RLHHTGSAHPARLKRAAHFQSSAGFVCSTSHAALLAPVASGAPEAAASEAVPRETRPHSRGAVVSVECSSSTLPKSWQLCRKCNYPTLWATAQRGVVGPFFAVSRFQGSFDQPQEAVVVDVGSKDMHQDGMVD